ncbi:MAG: PmbA/TldA family metallopeptidase, partial [Candidatus Heimdallarchaeota archaeon]
MDEDLYNQVFEMAAKENASYADIRDEDTLYASIEVVDGKVEKSMAGSEAGIGIRLLIDGAWGFSYGSKEKYKDVFKMAIDAQKTSKTLSKSDIELAEVKPIQAKEIISQKKPSQDIAFEEKMKLVLNIDKYLRDTENKIKATRTRYVDFLRRQTIATSEGTLIYEERPYTYLAMTPTAKEG